MVRHSVAIGAPITELKKNFFGCLFFVRAEYIGARSLAPARPRGRGQALTAYAQR